MGYISPEPMYPDRGDISAPLDADLSLSKDKLHTSPDKLDKTPLLRLRNGALQAGLNDRLHKVVAKRMVSGGLRVNDACIATSTCLSVYVGVFCSFTIRSSIALSNIAHFVTLSFL